MARFGRFSREEQVRKQRWRGVADAAYEVVPNCLPFEDLDFNPEKQDGDVRFRRSVRETHAVLFGCNDGVQIPPDAA